MTTTTIDRYAGIHPDLLTPKVIAALDDLAESQAFIEGSAAAVAAADQELARARDARDVGWLLQATAAREVAAEAAKISPPHDAEGAIAIRNVLMWTWEQFRILPKPTTSLASSLFGNLCYESRQIKPRIDAYAQDPAKGDAPELLAAASRFLGLVEAYVLQTTPTDDDPATAA